MYKEYTYKKGGSSSSKRSIYICNYICNCIYNYTCIENK